MTKEEFIGQIAKQIQKYVDLWSSIEGLRTVPFEIGDTFAFRFEITAQGTRILEAGFVNKNKQPGTVDCPVRPFDLDRALSLISDKFFPGETILLIQRIQHGGNQPVKINRGDLFWRSHLPRINMILKQNGSPLRLRSMGRPTTHVKFVAVEVE